MPGGAAPRRSIQPPRCTLRRKFAFTSSSSFTTVFRLRSTAKLAAHRGGTRSRTDLSAPSGATIRILVTFWAMASFCVAAQPSTSAPSPSGLNRTSSAGVIMTREHLLIVDDFNEKEIARSATDGSTSGVAVDRVPMAAERRLRRRREHLKSNPSHDSDLVASSALSEAAVAATTPSENTASEPMLSTGTTMAPVGSRVDGGVWHTPQQNHPSSGFSLCENNGTYVNGKCRCYFPFAGERCADYACEHGLSVGPRYDPDSTFFNRKCICDEDWAGEYCNIPIADQCNERGQYIRGRCKCHGYYFGPKCQYVGKCVEGKLLEGICKCNYGYEGDYCDRIVCHHGYRDKSNGSNSCVCPPRHSGAFCDECALTGDYILPYPNCTEERIPQRARMSRKKTDDQLLARVFIIGVALLILMLFMSAMFLTHWGRQRAEQYDVNGAQLAREKQRVVMEERKQLLERAIYLQTFPAPRAGRGSLDVTLSAENLPQGSAIVGVKRNNRFLNQQITDDDSS